MRYEGSPAGLSPLVPVAAGRPGRNMLFVLPVRGGTASSDCYGSSQLKEIGDGE